MVRFGPLLDGDDDSDASSYDGSEMMEEDQSQPIEKRIDESEEEEEEEDEIQLPLRGRATPQVSHKYRSHVSGDIDMGHQSHDDEKYSSRHYTPAGGSSRTDAQQKLQLMDSTLFDEEEENFLRHPTGGEEEMDHPIEPVETMRFLPTKKSTRPTRVRKSPLDAFLETMQPFMRSQTNEHHPRNPLATPTAVVDPPQQRSTLSFLSHSFRACWTPSGSGLFFPNGIDGFTLGFQPFDPFAVDMGVQDPLAESGSIASKKLIAETSLQAHLEFHTTHHAPSAAKQFGPGAAAAAAAAASTAPFQFGAAAVSSSSSSSSSLTPFTELVDSHLISLRRLLSSSSATAFGPVADRREVELAISTLTLLRSLYSKEAAEQHAPKLSRGSEQEERKARATNTTGEDISILTAREDPYAIQIGREAAFEEDWLQSTIGDTYVKGRIAELRAASSSIVGSDGLAGSRMLEVIAHLVGHDLFAAADACIAAGNFRLATLIAQLNSFNVTGRLVDAQDGSGPQPIIESSQHDIARQLAAWTNKERGVGAYIPNDIETIYRLMSGDVFIQPELGWIESLGLTYWYTQPKSDNTNIHKAMINYKRHAFMEQARTQVRKPFPPYATYVPVDDRGVTSSDGADGDVDMYDDSDADVGSQALVVASSSNVSRTRKEYYDLRYGLLDLYTGQSRSLPMVLSPQTHVPHVIDHNLAWHLYAIMQNTPINQFGPYVARLHMSYIHQLELLSEISSSSSSDDFWKWTIYVALSSPISPDQPYFDRESIVKSILLRHVTWDVESPFRLAHGHAGGNSSKLPTSLPILRIEAEQNVFAIALHADQRTNQQQQLSWNFGSSSSSSAGSIDDFLLARCHLPASWLYESKAISAVSSRAWSVACFYFLHAGQVDEAYRIFREHIMVPWILIVLNQAESGDSTAAPGVDSLEDQLFRLLQLFHSSSSSPLSGGSGGVVVGMVLAFFEFRRHFTTNLAHFTSFHEMSIMNPSNKARQERFDNFRDYTTQLKTFLKEVDAFAEVQSNDVTNHAFERLAWTKMSGTILQLLHALEPLAAEIARASASEVDAAAGVTGVDGVSSSPPLVDVSVGEFVSAADRFAVLTEWKDAFIQQFS